MRLAAIFEDHKDGSEDLRLVINALRDHTKGRVGAIQNYYHYRNSMLIIWMISDLLRLFCI